ncbi:transposase [Spirosoma areae]
MTNNPDDLLNRPRNSHMDFGQVYFWTNTIHNWKRLLTPEKYKQIIINCWQELVNRGRIAVYAFVIMPNHLHIVWEMLEPNGKEMPHASFNKFTAHQFLTDLKTYHPHVLTYFEVNNDQRQYRFWQRDALAVRMDNQDKLLQKIDYIHNNPLQERWSLATRPEEYRWSSAQFYETGVDEFGFLTHYRERFG